MKYIKHFILSLVFLAGGLFIQAQDLTKDKTYGEQGLELVKQQMGLYENEPLENLITQIGKKLVNELEKPLFDYEFYLVDSPEPNAFALPGGKIFVTRGLLALPITEDEIAGVMGHEIIHSNNRHGVKTSAGSVFGNIIAIPGVIVGGIFGGPIGQAVASPFLTGNELLQANYSRGNEKEADKEGIELAAKAGYEPIQLAHILNRLSIEAELLTGESEEKSYFSSHPYTPKRVDAITKYSGQYTQSASNPILKSTSFLIVFDGLNIGNNPEYGYVHEEVFYHPQDHYSFKLDAEWQTAITPATLSLGSVDGDAILSFTVETDSLTFKEYLTSFEKAMLDQTSAKPTRKGDFEWFGHKGEFLEYVSNANNQVVKFQLIALEYGPHRVFKIASLYAESKEEKVKAIFKNAKVISSSDLPATTVPSIKIVEAMSDETLDSLIKGYDAEEYGKLILVLNEKDLSSTIKKGSQVKLVVNKPVKF